MTHPSSEESGYVNEASVDLTAMADLVASNGLGFYLISFEAVDLMAATFLNRDLVVSNSFEEH
jgi:hypothetical protein